MYDDKILTHSETKREEGAIIGINTAYGLLYTARHKSSTYFEPSGSVTFTVKWSITWSSNT